LYSTQEKLNAKDEMLEDYYDEFASLIFGPHWRTKPDRNHYKGLSTIQQAKFSSLVRPIVKKNGANSGFITYYDSPAYHGTALAAVQSNSHLGHLLSGW